MSNEVQQAKTLQERVGDRIRDQIGDLMTDEDLKTLVDKALHEAFFTRTEVPNQHWNAPKEFNDSFAVKHVKGLLKERVDAACATWLAEHKEELGAHIDEAVGKGLLGFFTTWLDQKVQQDLFNFGNQLKQRLGIN
jgi:hypothetical protein